MKKNNLLLTTLCFIYFVYNGIIASQPERQLVPRRNHAQQKPIPNAIKWSIKNKYYGNNTLKTSWASDFRNQDGESLLHIACRARDTNAIAALLKYGFYIDTKTTYGENTPLHTASSKGYTTIVLFLLKNKIVKTTALNNGNKFFLTPLNLACLHKHPETVKALLKQPLLDPNESDADCSTPLHNAVENGSTDIVALLLEHPKTDPNLQTYINGKPDNTPLHIACYTNNSKAVELQLDHEKINVEITNSYNLTAWQIAHKNNNQEIIHHFIKYDFLKTLFSTQKKLLPVRRTFKKTRDNNSVISFKTKKDSEPTLISVKTTQ